MSFLTREQATKLKKGDELMWFSFGMAATDSNHKPFPSGWCLVKFDSKKNVQGDAVVIVEYLPGQYVNSFYSRLKLVEEDDLFKEWTG